MLIVGASGKIAQRYKAILNYLGHPFYSYDVNFKEATWPLEKSVQAKDLHKIVREEPAVLIATPSDTHFKVLKRFYHMGYRRFLIEKPIFTQQLDYELAREFEGADIRGIANYRYVDGAGGHTIYDYYDAGGEKWYWNLFQIIAMAKSTLTVKRDSPVWSCTLNGKKLTLEEVHKSYIFQIQEFLSNPEKCLSLDEGEEWFFKVRKFVQKQLASESKPDLAQKDSPGKSSQTSSPNALY
jgi:hypothetical protein